MIEPDGVCDTRQVVYAPSKQSETAVVDESLSAGTEQGIVDAIEANERREDHYIGQCRSISEKECSAVSGGRPHPVRKCEQLRPRRIVFGPGPSPPRPPT